MGGSPERPQPRPRIPAVAGPSGGAASAHGPDLSPHPPAGALPSLPAARRVTAAAPPPSWARRALPTSTGSGSPARGGGGRPLPSFPNAAGEEAGAFYSLCAGWDPQSTLGFCLHPSPAFLCARKKWQGPSPIVPNPSNLRQIQGRGHASPHQCLARSWSLTCLCLFQRPRHLGSLSYTPRQRPAVTRNPRTSLSVGPHLHLSGSQVWPTSHWTLGKG